MKELVIGREKLALALTLESAEGFEIPRDYEPEFTARLLRWYREPELDAEGNPVPDEDDAPDTLELTVVPEEKLKNSGMRVYAVFSDGTETELAGGNAEIKELISILRCGNFPGWFCLGGGAMYPGDLTEAADNFRLLLKNM